MGNSTPASIQCPECCCLRSTSPKSKETDSSVLQCSECRWNKTYKLPEGFSWCHGENPNNGLERGAWTKRVEKIVAEESGMSDGKMEVSLCHGTIPPTPSCSTTLGYHPQRLFNQLPCFLPFLLFVGHISYPVSHYAYITIIFKPQIM